MAQCGGNRTGQDVQREVKRSEPLKPAERLGYGAGEPATELKGLEVGEIGNGARDWPGKIAVYMERLEERKFSNDGWDVLGFNEYIKIKVKRSDSGAGAALNAEPVATVGGCRWVPIREGEVGWIELGLDLKEHLLLIWITLCG